jgi:hypothetical protein
MLKRSGFRQPSFTEIKEKQAIKREKDKLKPRKPATLKKIGKVGKANIQSRKRIAEIAEEKNLTRCEIQFEGCTLTWPLAPAHRHKRAWYKGDAELLADYNQWVCACQNCHDKIEHDAELTEQVFEKLRA